MVFARLLFFSLLTLATPYAASIAAAAETAAASPAAAPAAAPAATPAAPDRALPASECGPTGTYVASLNSCLQVGGATVWQVNLKTGDTSHLAVLVGVAVVHQDVLRLGGGFYCGAGMAIHGPNAGQCDLLLIARFGTLGFGTELFQVDGRAVYQGLFSLGLALPGVQ
jgi:hypothetical protein